MERLTKRGKTHPEYVYMATELIGECKGGCQPTEPKEFS